MVLVRTLLSAPTPTPMLSTFSFLHARQFLFQWRSSSSSSTSSCSSAFYLHRPLRSHCSLVTFNGDTLSASDGVKASKIVRRARASVVLKNGRIRRPSNGFPQRGEWADATQTQRVRCLGTFASNKELSIRFPISLEETTVVDSSAQAAVDQLQIDGPLALKHVVEELNDLEQTEIVELSLLLCNDAYIRDLNLKWLGKDSPTDVLSFPQDQAPGLTPHWLLGDVIISLDTAARQAEERHHTLLDELRILLVHGLLHLLGHDHELGPESSLDMEEAEAQILSKLSWNGKGLISEAFKTSSFEDVTPTDTPTDSRGNEPARKPAPKSSFKILFLDMDGTLLNRKSIITDATGDAIRAALAKGVQVVIATGKSRYGAMKALQRVGLSGEGGAISSTSPGVFTQGLQVYGRGGSEIYKALLDPNIVREAFAYSLDHDLATVGFSGDNCVTLFRTPLTDKLSDVYLEPKAHVMQSIDELMANFPIQKILFYGTPESVKHVVRPDWAAKTKSGTATLVQALDEMLEMLPPGQSKGRGVRMLLDHLDVSPEEVMAIGDGENDVEMLSIAGWGVVMANGAAEAKAVADAFTGSNDEDGAAQAIYKYIVSPPKNLIQATA